MPNQFVFALIFPVTLSQFHRLIQEMLLGASHRYRYYISVYGDSRGTEGSKRLDWRILLFHYKDVIRPIIERASIVPCLHAWQSGVTVESRNYIQRWALYHQISGYSDK